MNSFQRVYRWPLLRFLAVGFSNLAITYSVYLLALLTVNYQWAYVMAFISGTIYTGILNIHHTFSRKLSHFRVFLYAVYYCGYAMANLACITILVEILGMAEQIAFLAVQAVLVPLHYLLSKLLIAKIAPAR